MLEPDKLRAQARRDYAAQATAAEDLHEAVRLRQLAKSYLLLEKNARWLLSTDAFLDALRDNRRWRARLPEQAAPTTGRRAIEARSR